MKTSLSKSQTQQKINEFFARKSFRSEEVKKIKRLAMKYNIKLGVLRRKFCKRCFSQLKGSTRITKNHKKIICGSCGALNSFRLDARARINSTAFSHYMLSKT